MSAQQWRERTIAWINQNPPPLGAPPGSRTPRSAAEHAEWTAWTRAMHAAGLAVAQWPREWGGSAITSDEALAITEVFAAAGAPLSLCDIGINLVGPAVMSAGSDAQRAEHLPPITSGSVIWTQLFSEPEAGSDLAAARTSAVAEGDGWRITGQKVWSTYAHIAQWGFLIARTGTAAERHRGLSAFLLPMTAPGVTIRPLREITGDHDFNEVFLDGVRLGPEHLLGEPGQGWAIAMNLLVDERLVTGRHVIGLCAEMDRIASLVEQSNAAQLLFVGELCADVTAARALALTQPLPEGAETMSKIAFSELNAECHLAALDFSRAPDGSTPPGWSARWEDGYLYTRGYTISGGANEVLRNVLAKRVLRLPTQ